MAQAAASAPKPAPKAAPAAAGGRLLELTAAQTGAKFSYNPSTITAKPGETIHLRLKAAGPPMPKMAMAHNFVLLKPGTKIDAFENDALAAGMPANFIPAKRKADILASTPLAGIGDTVETTFKAPLKPGSYPFVCTFPGHEAGGMKGTLVVK
jgi:azurin